MTQAINFSDTLDTDVRVGTILRAAAPATNPGRPYYINPFMSLANRIENEQTLAAVTNRMVSAGRPFAEISEAEMGYDTVKALGDLGLLRFETVDGKSYAAPTVKLLGTLEDRCVPKATPDDEPPAPSQPDRRGFVSRMVSRVFGASGSAPTVNA